ncbi:hypothetical protein [Clostridium chromiireducens]|uniref:Uncharacterized protein n=1 Tax=Clostridium chromiireducens TaxID=225345 RepID=A0A1V4I3T6_9CLOT|nr:hypothetical protein [Clostridium chromiireducens]OPJ54648.1 hypothetical protein CLCHR_48000 [Clostridium chromiireducens]
MNEKMHEWSIVDDIVAFYLYKYSTKEINYSYNEISNKLGMSKGSLRMRKAMYSYLDKNVGLSKLTNQTIQVYECLKDLDSREFREIIEELLA